MNTSISVSIEKKKILEESSLDCLKRVNNEKIKKKKALNALYVYLVIAFVAGMAFFNRLYSVIKYESIIHEFDPWFNYRSTKFYVENGFYEFLNWLDDTAWYPLGRIVGGTVFPGLMFTSGFFYHTLHFLGIPVHIREICVFMAPIFSSFTVVATYFLTKEIWNSRAGLLASLFISIAPGYISRSVAGSYDNEGIAIFALVFTFYLWIKAIKTGKIFWGIFTAFSYWYMVAAWGGYVFITNMISLHAFVLLVMGFDISKLYKAYCTYYILGTIFSMQIPFVSYAAVSTSEHLPALGVFGLLQLVGFSNFIKEYLTPEKYKFYLKYVLSSVVVLAIVSLIVLENLGIISPLTGRFYSLFDTSYAQIHIPIISSVAEHQPTPWSSFFVDLHFLPFLMIFGMYLCIENNNAERTFAVLYGVFSSYFAGVMVRLILTITPIMCILGAIGLSSTLDSLIKLETGESNGSKREEKGKNIGTGKKRNIFVAIAGLVLFGVLLIHFIMHCTYITRSHYSSPSVVLAYDKPDGSMYIMDDFREAYYWLNRNTKPDARILSWWDYGYQIAGFSNRTTIVDNNTWNNTHIATVGKALASNETVAYKIFRQLDVDYVLIIFGGLTGYSGDDINKFLWMVRIAQGEFPRDVKETNYFSESAGYNVGDSVSKTMKESIMFKTSYYNFDKVRTHHGRTKPFDNARKYEVPANNIKLETIEEAFTSEHWIVRIYKVKDLENRKNYFSQGQIRV